MVNKNLKQDGNGNGKLNAGLDRVVELARAKRFREARETADDLVRKCEFERFYDPFFLRALICRRCFDVMDDFLASDNNAAVEFAGEFKGRPYFFECMLIKTPLNEVYERFIKQRS